VSASEVRVLATPAVAAGFALAGLDARTAASPREGAERLAALLADPAVAVLLVEHDLVRALPAADQHDLMRRATPLIVPFEGPAWEAEPEREMEVILDILRRAIGYRVRLQ
jgi:vacuolar-type H+-ATPase subunit F/Vma7